METPYLVQLAVTAAILAHAWADFFFAPRLAAKERPSRAPQPPSPPPRLTVLVPARDEELNIAACLAGLAAQDHPDFEVLVIDDGSRDATAEIVRTFAARDPRIQLLTCPERPPGWQGKSWALHQGARAVALGSGAARGPIGTDARATSAPWMAMIDADVVLGPHALRRAAALARERGVVLLSLLPALHDVTFWEKVIQPVIGFFLFVGQPLWLVRAPRSKVVVANGQFLLVERASYERAGGHEAVKDAIVEDVELARTMKRLGMPLLLTPAFDDLRVRMYRGLGGLWRGWGKTIHPYLAQAPIALWLGILPLLAVFLAPFLALPVLLFTAPSSDAALAQVAAVTLILSSALGFRRAGRHELLHGLLWPVAILVLLALFVVRTVGALRGQGVPWKGRVYGADGRGGLPPPPPPPPLRAHARPAPPSIGGRAQGIPEGARAALVATGLALTACLPSRWVLSSLAEQGTSARLRALALGASADLAVLALPCALGAAALALAPRVPRAAKVAVLLVLTIALWTFMVSTTESSLSRGIFPTWVDVRIMQDSPDMMRGSLAMFALQRNLVPALLTLPVIAALLDTWPGNIESAPAPDSPSPPAGTDSQSARPARDIPSTPAAADSQSARPTRDIPSRRRPRALPFLGALATGLALFALAHTGLFAFAHTGLFALGDSRAPNGAATPLSLLAPPSFPEALACARGPCEPRAQLAHVPPSPGTLTRGAALLGWPPPHPEGDSHPFARPFPAAETRGEPRTPLGPSAGHTPLGPSAGHTPLGPSAGHTPLGPSAAGTSAARDLLVTLDALSDQLFADDPRPIHVFQIAMEGMRGDDLHPLNPAAPRELAPFLASLYDHADALTPGALASRRTWTAGVRTPHGLAALQCGLGTLPFGLALPRDLPGARLRCLPDILADAGFSIGHAYGGALAFDRIGPFLTEHRSTAWVSPDTLPAGTPQGAWGASDRAVYTSLAAATPRDESTYALLLTLSHHHPFTLPEDLPPEVRARAEQAFTAATPRADLDDQRRLVTLAYADDALAGFFATLETANLLDRSIVCIAADHAIPDRALWQHRASALSPPASRASIPLLLWISPALLASARDPAAARALATSAQSTLADLPLSQNDVPTLLLSLLAHTPPLRALASRGLDWHSMGGQSTSPWYAAPGPSATRIHGIHAGTALYFVDALGTSVAPDEPAPFMVTADEGQSVTPSLRPAAAALNLLLSRDPESTPPP